MRLRWVLLLLCVACVACGSGGGGRGDDDGVPAAVDGPFPVVDVVDGDTIKVDTPERITVRVIGIDTPETVDPRRPVECFGREASDRATALLDGEDVYLEMDPSQGDTDRFGRTLAHVWLTDGRLFGETMIADGYAHEYTYDLPYEHQAAYRAAARRARAADVGLWHPDACA
jgi:micrococcal nuclease